MKIKLTKTKTVSIEEHFRRGLASGMHPHPLNTEKAVTAVTKKSTEPHVRAYWTGYLCQLAENDSTALTNI